MYQVYVGNADCIGQGQRPRHVGPCLINRIFEVPDRPIRLNPVWEKAFRDHSRSPIFGAKGPWNATLICLVPDDPRRSPLVPRYADPPNHGSWVTASVSTPRRLYTATPTIWRDFVNQAILLEWSRIDAAWRHQSGDWIRDAMREDPELGLLEARAKCPIKHPRPDYPVEVDWRFTGMFST